MTAPVRLGPPQAFISSYAPRIRTYGNALLTPVAPSAPQVPLGRAGRSGRAAAQAVNYAELDGYDEDDFEDDEGRRRPTGLRSLRREEQAGTPTVQVKKVGLETDKPVAVQGIWRDWMGKQGRLVTERQLHIQNALPLTLIPIRIDLEIPSFRPEAPLPTPSNAREYGIDESLPAYKQPDPTPAYRLHDSFLWNLHEALMTPDQFAKKFVEELDFPYQRKFDLIQQISNQIRTQLEEYAGVALHPLFHSPDSGHTASPTSQGAIAGAFSQAQTPMPPTNGTSTPLPTITATASPAPPQLEDSTAPTYDVNNPDDTYRCLVNLSVSHLSLLYSDKFEWSLLHPPGLAEAFSRATCADNGLSGEWVSTIAHAIYEAVLKLKKEVCENGGLLAIAQRNESAPGTEAGWRYAPEDLGIEWEPRLEELSKEEIEKREGDRERQLRRVRRETARFSSTANTSGTRAHMTAEEIVDEEEMGRGARSKKKRRFRSLSPSGRDTPDANGAAGYGGGAALTDDERRAWRCAHCLIWGPAVWAVRDGPTGSKTLCHNCGFLYERDKQLPPWSKDYFAYESYQGLPPPLARR